MNRSVKVEVEVKLFDASCDVCRTEAEPRVTEEQARKALKGSGIASPDLPFWTIVRDAQGDMAEQFCVLVCPRCLPGPIRDAIAARRSSHHLALARVRESFKQRNLGPDADTRAKPGQE